MTSSEGRSKCRRVAIRSPAVGLREDRLTVASLAATAERLAGSHADDALGEALGADLDRGHGAALDQALATIGGISTDPRLLTDAAARLTTEPAVPQRVNALRLLAAAGADEDEARRIQAARGRGWRTPQAEAWKPQPGRDGDGVADVDG